MNHINNIDVQKTKDTSQDKIPEATSDVKQEVVDVMNQDMPVIWQEIYLDSALYMSRWRDDFMWGRATINMVKKDEDGTVRFSVVEKPGTTMNWSGHRRKQKELKERFWDQRARPDPDYRPEFNTW